MRIMQHLWSSLLRSELISQLTIPSVGASISRSPLRRGFFLIPLVLVCFGLSPTARAVDPRPDGGYPNQNTAEGEDALFHLTSGGGNTAIGFNTLFNNTHGDRNTAVGASALMGNANGEYNTAIGASTLFNNTDGDDNTAVGQSALASNTLGQSNTAMGSDALFWNGNGSNNTASGLQALLSNTSGSNNTAEGYQALFNNTAGDNNVALGNGSGFNLTSGSNNIDIGNVGVAGESGITRIGTLGTQTATFIAGIRGTPIAAGAAVGITAHGQLGVRASSERFKEAIKPMEKASEAIFSLQPVTFRYKKALDPAATPQFGLVAEQVAKVNPDLVVADDQGKPFSVRYEEVNAMLLNEFLKEHRTMQELKTTVAQQQKQIEALTAGLQKVSAQVDMSKPAPQMVNNP